ncbi:MAG: hypothetical protein WC951_09390 [Bacteroidales bacterium]
MSTLLIKRPKDKEKYYDESNFKIYINGELVEKLGQNDTKEITVEGSNIEIKAKSKGFGGSAKATIELEEKTELEIVRTKNLYNPMVVGFLFPFLVITLRFTETCWVKILVYTIAILVVGWAVYYYFKNKDKAISITKV